MSSGAVERVLAVEEAREPLTEVLTDAAAELEAIGMMRLASAVEKARGLIVPGVQFDPHPAC